MKLSAILEPMIAAGVPGEVILATVKAFEEQQSDALERRREADRKKMHRRRDREDVSRAEWYGLCNAVLDRDGKICAYCGDEVGPHQVDHVVPLARGGTSVLDNLVVACRACNASKKDRLLEEWRPCQ